MKLHRFFPILCMYRKLDIIEAAYCNHVWTDRFQSHEPMISIYLSTYSELLKLRPYVQLR